MKVLSALHTALIEEVRATPMGLVADPLAVGLEAAAALRYTATTAPLHEVVHGIANSLMTVLPASAGPVDRGIAIGAAAVLAMELRYRPVERA